MSSEFGVCPSRILHPHKSDWDGAIIPQEFTTSPSIINTMLWMKKNAYGESEPS
jgi:hypothetical protein